MRLYKGSMQEITVLEVKPVEKDMEKMKKIIKGFIETLVQMLWGI